MIGHHLWPQRGPWTLGESRRCEKCGHLFSYIARPRTGRVFAVDFVPVGRMPRCAP